MNKKQVRLTESDLKQIVKESVNKILNEAYGTIPTDDAHNVSRMDFANRKNRASSKRSSILPRRPYNRPYGDDIYSVQDSLMAAYREVGGLPPSIYTDALNKHLEKCIYDFLPKIIKQEIMHQGEQPNEFYAPKDGTFKDGYFKGEKYVRYAPNGSRLHRPNINDMHINRVGEDD